MTTISDSTIARVATWPMIVRALHSGHLVDRAQLGDTLLTQGDCKMLVRSAWVPGIGSGVKAVTVYPDNPNRPAPLPSVQGQVLLFNKDTGSLAATLSGGPVTQWKTAADSALGSQLLSREDSQTLLMVGAGAMAEPLVRAHLSVRPGLKQVLLFNRSAGRVQALAQRLTDLPVSVTVVDELAPALERADIISCATLSVNPLIEGRFLRAGTHLDLVGAYTPEMREADDVVMQRGRIFVDSLDTTVGHIGEIQIPIDSGVLLIGEIQGDLYDLVQGRAGRAGPNDITVFKNGGGAHLDVMVAAAIFQATQQTT